MTTPPDTANKCAKAKSVAKAASREPPACKKEPAAFGASFGYRRCPACHPHQEAKSND